LNPLPFWDSFELELIPLCVSLQLEHARPISWDHLNPHESYNFVVIGGGRAGITAALNAARLGAKVAIVERHLFGGDALISGAVPSATLIQVARMVADIEKADTYGIKTKKVSVEFEEVMARVRKVRAQLSIKDSPAALQESGVDVYFGEAQFADKMQIKIDGKLLKFSSCCVASGSSPGTKPHFLAPSTFPHLDFFFLLFCSGSRHSWSPEGRLSHQLNPV